jgi:hypothetical protein
VIARTHQDNGRFTDGSQSQNRSPELTLVEIDRHGSKVEEFDVEGILNFAERVLPRAADLWIQASLEQRQRLQRLFFPEGVAFSGKSFDRTVVTSSLFEYLRPLDGPQEN